MSQHIEYNNILVLKGSPRKKGNSATLAEEIANGATAAGASVESIYLHGLDIAPCQACYACQTPDSKGCAIDDDMQQIYPKLVDSQAWVFASPVYWFNMSAQTKLLLDRCFALMAYDKKAFLRKKIAVAMVYGDADAFVSGCVNALRCFQDAFSYVGAKLVGSVYGSANDPGEIADNAALLAQARELGERLAK